MAASLSPNAVHGTSQGINIHLMSVQTRTMKLSFKRKDALDHVSLKKEKATRNSTFIIGLKKIALGRQSSLLTKMRIFRVAALNMTL